MAAIFPFKLCASILQGFAEQLNEDGIMEQGTVGMHTVEESAHSGGTYSVDAELHEQRSKGKAGISVSTGTELMPVDGRNAERECTRMT